MADEPAARETGEGATKRLDLKVAKVSSRIPPVIEGEAQELAPPTPGTMSDIAESLTGRTQERVTPQERVAPHAPSVQEAPEHIAIAPDGVAKPVGDVPPRRSRGPLWIGALVVLLGASGLGWLYANSDDGDLMSGVRRITGGDAPRPAVAQRTDASRADRGASNPPSPVRAPAPAVPAPAVPASPRPATSAPAAVAVPSAAPPTPAPQPTITAVPLASVSPAAAAAVSPPVDSARLAALESRIADLDAKMSTRLSAAVAALNAAPAKPAPETASALDAQATRLGAIEGTLDRLDKRLAAVETKLAPPKSETRAPEAPAAPAARATDEAAARVVVAQGLLAAVQSGGAYVAPLAAMRGLGAEEPSLSRLEASAAGGIPTLASLRDQFTALRPQFRPAPATSSDASWRDKAWARVSSLVRVRPAGESAGPSSDAVASRIEAALGRGDLAGALDLARSLPAADQARAKDWIEGATRRLTAETDARALLTTALGALAKPKS